MNDPSRSVADIFAHNDSEGDLRETVASYKRQARSSGGGDGMEPRIARLEADVGHVQRDIAELKTDVREFRADIRDVRERLARVEERIVHLPGKGFIVASVLLSLAVIGGLVTFQGQIQEWAGTQRTTTAAQP